MGRDEMRRAASRYLRGVTLIAVGSDLAGGHARRAFKLPNPMYFIP